MSSRPNTPDRVNADGSKTIIMKRACNGCGQHLGDVTDEEMAAAMNARPLPDVRRECPSCGPTAPEPKCLPVTIEAGDIYCLERDCDHDIVDGADHCEHVREEVVCSIHSTFATGPEDTYEFVTRTAAWPCKQTAAAEAGVGDA